MYLDGVFDIFDWLKSFFKKKEYTCVSCGTQTKSFEKTATIKVRCGENEIFDMIICKKCADTLEKMKHGSVRYN